MSQRLKKKVKPITANHQIAAQVQAIFQQALTLHQQNQFEQAQILYEEILKVHPNHFDVLHLLGVVALQTKKAQKAVALIGKAIKINPHNPAFYNNQGLALKELNQIEAALASYDKAIALKPDFAQAYNNRGIALKDLKLLDAALASYDQAIAIEPWYAEAHSNRGNALKELQQFEAALASCDQAIALKSDNATAYSNRGNALHELKQFSAALASYDQAIAIEPYYAEAYSNRGVTLKELKQFEAALASCDKAIAIKPDNAAAYSNRGNILHELKQFNAALASYDQAIALKSDYAEAYNNRSTALYDLRQFEAALASCDKAIAIKPDYAEAYNNRGLVLYELKQPDAAVTNYNQAITIRPDFAEAYNNRGNALKKLQQPEAVLASYDQALALKPDYDFLYGIRLHAKMHICAWLDAEKQLAELIQKIYRDERATSPFPILALSTSLPLQRKSAEIWVKEKYPANLELGNISRSIKGAKIRLGYFSMDFRDHPVSFLTAELFEIHDRNRFEVIAFSFGSDTKDEMRQRLEGAFDKFVEVREKSDREIAEMARLLEIDIAIDLAGHTADSRTGIFAMRAAPIQVNFLGYSGTMGADYMDYLIADRQLIPEEAEIHYSEKVVYLPSFQPNDRKRKISDRVFTRAELGLPETGFVFCCFNNNYKITPSTFAGWMRILRQVEGSVLWLSKSSPAAVNNLRQEAVARGVEARRLVFAECLPLSEDHLARQRAADLFIDTFPYNAHTTASDALWAGLPVLTCPGEAFASRVAASLLTAIEMPELITRTPDEYEALAVELATNPERLRAIRQKLERNRLTTPLFDSRLFTRHLEEACAQMYERWHADLPPEHIHVE